MSLSICLGIKTFQRLSVLVCTCEHASRAGINGRCCELSCWEPVHKVQKLKNGVEVTDREAVPGLTSSTLTIHVRPCSKLFIHASTLFDVIYPCFAVVDVNYPCSTLFDDNMAQIFDDNMAQIFDDSMAQIFDDNMAQIFDDNMAQNFRRKHRSKFRWLLSSKYLNLDPCCRRKIKFRSVL